MSVHDVHTTRQDLLNLIPVEFSTTGQPTPAQAELMKRLMADIRELDQDVYWKAQQYTARMNGHWTPGREGNASRWIDRLIAKVKELRNAASGVLEDGVYLMDGNIYKVQRAIHGSGQKYAKRLLPNSKGERAIFIYAPGVVRKLRPEHRMTMEQAKQWGALYGTCVRCGALLTAEDSIERMMGPVCATKI